MILIAILALAAPALAGRFPASWAGTWSVIGIKQVQINAGNCGDECSVYHVSGTRGAAPVESTTWSTVKSLYE